MTGVPPRGSLHPRSLQTVSVGGSAGIQLQGTTVVTGGVAFPPVEGGIASAPVAGMAVPQTAAMTPTISYQLSDSSRSPTRTSSAMAELGSLIDGRPRQAALMLALAGLATLLVPPVILSVLGFTAGWFVAPILFSLLQLGGAAWVMKRAKVEQDGLNPALEQPLLALAMQLNGVLTVTSTAHGLGIGLDEAEAALMILARAGHVQIDNDSESGAVIYIFPEIKPAAPLPQQDVRHF